MARVVLVMVVWVVAVVVQLGGSLVMSSADTQGFQTILEDAETFSPHTLLRYAVKFYLQKKR